MLKKHAIPKSSFFWFLVTMVKPMVKKENSDLCDIRRVRNPKKKHFPFHQNHVRIEYHNRKRSVEILKIIVVKR